MITKLSNEYLEISTLSLGAILQKLVIKDHKGKAVNVVGGYEYPADYQPNDTYLGATIGRCASRLAGGFDIDGIYYPLYQKNGVHLHGGKQGFNAKIWRIISQDTNHITYELESPDGDEGYPGCLKVTATYALEDRCLIVTYTATTDTPTIVNITNHSYFNLNGEGSILSHNLQLFSDEYLECNSRQLPTGRLILTEGTPQDYRALRAIGGHSFVGVDGCFILKDNLVAILSSEQSGIRMRVETNQPSVVVYTPEWFEDKIFADGALYTRYPSICFETQHYTDAPNHSNFPSSILRPSEQYLNRTIFSFDYLKD